MALVVTYHTCITEMLSFPRVHKYKVFSDYSGDSADKADKNSYNISCGGYLAPSWSATLSI
jgi:hypothetical protein